MKDKAVISSLGSSNIVKLFTNEHSRAAIAFSCTLLDSLYLMEVQIRETGDFSESFETDYGVLGSFEDVKLKLEKLVRPFQVDLEFENAIKMIKDSFPDTTYVELIINAIHLVKEEIIDIYKITLNNIISLKKKLDIKAEKDNIIRKLNDSVIVNMSSSKISDRILQKYKNGRKWVGNIEYLNINEDKNPQGLSPDEIFKRNELAGILNRMYAWGGKQDKNLMRNFPKLVEDKTFNWNSLERDLVDFSKNNLDLDDINFLKNLSNNLENSKENFKLEKRSKDENTPKDKVLIEADKNQGIIMMDKIDVLNMYERNNKKHNYIRTELTEEDVVFDHLQKRDYLISLLPKVIKENLSGDLKDKINKPYGMVPIMRPLGKTQKLNNPSYKDKDVIQARMIKSSSGAPLNIVAEVMSELSTPLIDKLNMDLEEKFGFKPAMRDCSEVYDLLNSDEVINIEDFVIGFEFDAVDMYLQMDHYIIEKDIIEILDYFEKDEVFRRFFTESLEVLMSDNFFRQPGGIYTVGPNGSKGFSIGCFFASNGSDMGMVWREGKLLLKLFKLDLLKYIKVDSRYKDDGLLLLIWHPTKTMEILMLVCEAYPESLKLKFRASTVRVDFVDQSLYINHNNRCHVKLLRKKEASYDCPRLGSNMKQSSAFGTLYNYARRAIERNTLAEDRKINDDLYRMIITKRGFSLGHYNKIRKIVQDKINGKIPKRDKWSNEGKIFPGVLTFDKKSKCHKKLLGIIRKCKLPKKYTKPLPVPGKSVWKKEFNKKSFISKLDRFLEGNVQDRK